MRGAIPVRLREGYDALVALSRRSRFVLMAFIVAPTILLLTFFLFPVFEAKHLGFRYVLFTCFLAAVVAVGGMLAWFAEPRDRRQWTEWIYPVGFTATFVAAVWYLRSGSFYWAFERGYFLD